MSARSGVHRRRLRAGQGEQHTHLAERRDLAVQDLEAGAVGHHQTIHHRLPDHGEQGPAQHRDHRAHQRVAQLHVGGDFDPRDVLPHHLSVVASALVVHRPGCEHRTVGTPGREQRRGLRKRELYDDRLEHEPRPVRADHMSDLDRPARDPRVAMDHDEVVYDPLRVEESAGGGQPAALLVIVTPKLHLDEHPRVARPRRRAGGRVVPLPGSRYKPRSPWARPSRRVREALASAGGGRAGRGVVGEARPRSRGRGLTMALSILPSVSSLQIFSCEFRPARDGTRDETSL